MQNMIMHKARQEDLKRLRTLGEALGIEREADYFEKLLEYAAKAERDVFIIMSGEKDAGFCVYNREPKYALFRKLEIPEIQDLNVLREMRRKGFARAAIAFCEAQARAEKYQYMGIGVGIDVSYGAAQVLYTKLGYVPDGNGVTFDRQPVGASDFRPVGELCIMMIKNLDEKV